MSVVRRLPEVVQGTPTALAAYRYAARMHAGQVRRVDGTPFIRHPIEVATLLYEHGAPAHLVSAGLLHDVIEKTAATAPDLRRRFGDRVAELVLAVSEDEDEADYRARKAGLRAQVADAGDEALLLFAADKVAKVREFSLEFHRLGATRMRRLDHYRRCLELLEHRLAESPLVAQLRTQLDSLAAEAAQPWTAVG